MLAREGEPRSSQESGLRSCHKPGASVIHRSSGNEQCTADREMGAGELAGGSWIRDEGVSPRQAGREPGSEGHADKEL